MALLINTLSALVRLHELRHNQTQKTPSRQDIEIRRCESELSKEILKLYYILEERFGDSALMPMKNDICMGCYMHQPKGAMKEVFDQLYECHYCKRLLYNPEDLYDESGF